MDDGSLFQSAGEPIRTGQAFKMGDSITCSVREIISSTVQPNSVEVQFSCNGLRITSVVVGKPPGGFYGVIGMMTKSAAITLCPPVATRKQNFVEEWEISTPAFVQHKEDGICSYVGPGDLSERSIGSVRGTSPINPLGDLSQRSFSVRILKSGEKNFIGVGVINQTYPISLLPGWGEGSIGYHADSGEVFQGSSVGMPTNSHWYIREGDVMQCLLKDVNHSQKQVQVTFLRNGVKVIDIPAQIPSGGFYFCFGMMSRGEAVQVLLADILVPLSLPKLDFGEVWSIMSINIEHSGSGICKHIGEEKVGTIRSKKPLDPFSSANSFEVKIVESGESCFIAVGVCSQMYSIDDLPGWEDLSVGYHADEGTILQKTAGPERVSDPCAKGDVIRCTLESVDGSDKQMNVVYHKNGFFLGKAIFWKPGDGQVFAQIGSMSEGEVIQIASPLQSISQLQHDNPSALYAVPGHATSTGHGEDQEQRDYPGMSSSGFHSPFPGDNRTVEQYYRDIYVSHQFGHAPHHPGGHSLEMPSLGAKPRPLHTSPFPPGWPPYRGFGFYPQDLHSSLAVPVQPGSYHGNLQHFHNQPSESTNVATRPSYFHTSSSSVSAPMSEVPGLNPDLNPDLFSTSSLSSLDSGPEGMSGKVLEEEIHEERQHQLLQSLQPTYPSQHHLHSGSGGLNTPDPIHAEHTTLSGTCEELDQHPGGSLPATQSLVSLPSTETAGPYHGHVTSANRIVEPVILTKDGNKMFRILHNVQVDDDDGSLAYAALHPAAPNNSFILFRSPLSEKCNYYAVEVLEVGPSGNIAVGIVCSDYPVHLLPGILEGSVAYHSNGGAILFGSEAQSTDIPCITGDVIGCRLALKLKSEVCHSDENNQLIKVEFFRNGLVLHTQDVRLPINGFFPAIGLTGHGTKVAAICSMLQTPDSYFETHPLPDGHLNFPTPSNEPQGWQCLQRSKIEGNHLYAVDESHGKPSVIQSGLPFTPSSNYFHIQLQNDLDLYSVLSVGVACKLSSVAIPGEVSNSVGFLPTLGFFMSNGVICCKVANAVNFNLHGTGITIGVGVDYSDGVTTTTAVSTLEADNGDPELANVVEKMRVFFTLNGQQIHDILTELPQGGAFPTLAIESNSDLFQSLAIIEFPKQFPCRESNLPIGFCRHMADAHFQCCDSYTVLFGAVFTNQIKPVRIMQAAQPLSPTRSYFEVRIQEGGDTYRISCGLASYNYPLSKHPGWLTDSIAVHADDGNLFNNGKYSNVTAPLKHRGFLMGCGIRFLDDSITCNTLAEVFFTVNKKMIVSKLVKVPQLGFYPTIGVGSKGCIVEGNIHAQDPFPHLKFKTAIEYIENMVVDGSTVQLVTPSNPGAIRMSSCSSLQERNFMEVKCLSEINGDIFIGYSTGKCCPLSFVESKETYGFLVDIVSGKLRITDQCNKVRDTCSLPHSKIIGVGLDPIPDSSKFIFFITSNGYVISLYEVDIEEEADIYPCVLMVDSTTKLSVDLCSTWPKPSPIGRGWAECAHLRLDDFKITHSSTSTNTSTLKKRLPVGYAQAATPLTSSSCYFEVEICSRTANKAIAIGLASRTHSTSQWIGWSENSIGYHTDDGKLFKESNSGQSFGPKAYAGDTIGCGARLNRVSTSDASGVNPKVKVEVFFTINGALLNTQKFTVPSGGLFPTLCLESPSESVVFHRYKRFPPVDSLVDSRDWANAYSVKQFGATISNCCKHKEINGGLPKAFAQAREPFSVDNPYFQVKITSRPKNSILVGAAVKIPVGCTTPNTHSVLYSNYGQIIVRKGTQKFSKTSEKCDFGDVIGFCISFSNGVPDRVDIYINHSKVCSSEFTCLQISQDLYPTIVLGQPGNSVLPTLQSEFPSWYSPPLVGWLRSERVHINNNIIMYTGQGKDYSNIGVAQTSQPLALNAMTYYEVEIIECSEKCTVGMGAALPQCPQDTIPGWLKDSIGYHGDDGKLFHQSGKGVPFASPWKLYDVIGCGIRSSEHDRVENTVQVYFTKNGMELGHTTATVPPRGFFPVVGLHEPGLKIKISLGLPRTLPCNSNALRSQWRSLCGINVEKSPNGQLLSYRMNGRLETNPYALSLAVYAQSFSTTMQYFEIELGSIGSTGVAMGVTPPSFPLSNAPGSFRGSIAYHTVSGYLYYATPKGSEFGPVCHCGDVIGCGVVYLPNNTKHCYVFFTYNGIEIGRVRTGFPSNGLYPVICLNDPQDEVSSMFYETFKPRLSHSEVKYVNLMRINHCSYSEKIVTFKGLGDSGNSMAPAVAQFAVPLGRDHSYYTTNIVECKDTILIGLAVKDYPIYFAPGTSSVSLAYNILKGEGGIRAVYSNDDFITVDAPVCAQGDNVGCGIHFSDDLKGEGAYVYFTRNNQLVQKVDISDEFLLEDLYPIIGFMPLQRSSSVFMDWNNFVFEEYNIF